MKLNYKKIALTAITFLGVAATMIGCQSSGSSSNSNVNKVAGQNNGNGLAYATGTISGTQVLAELYNPTISATTDGSGNAAFTVNSVLAIQIGNSPITLQYTATLSQSVMAQGGVIQPFSLGNGIQVVMQANCSDNTACKDLLVSVLVIYNATPASVSQFAFIYSNAQQNVAQSQGGYSNIASYTFPQVTNTTNEVNFNDVEATLIATIPANN